MTEGAPAGGGPAYDEGELLELLERIATTAAPTGAEGERAELVAGLWRDAGLDVAADGVGNLVARLPATGGSGTLRLLVACHLDTVFPEAVDLTIRRTRGRWVGPGIGDNAASLSLLTYWLANRPTDLPAPALTVAATVGEEGLGDLRGARHLVHELGAEHDAFVALDGYLGSVCNAAVGSKRYEARFATKGGHSWGDYPSPSATHAAGRAIALLADLEPPKEPRASLNVGQIWGGTSVNAIASDAGFNLDVRSVDTGVLEELERAALAAIRAGAAAGDAELELRQVGDRPAGTSANGALVDAAAAALSAVGARFTTNPGSTDANAAFAVGLPAVSFGVYRGGNAHRRDEWVEPASFEAGLAAWQAFLGNLANLSPD